LAFKGGGANGYTLSGNAITLTNGIVAANNSGITENVGLNITLSGSQSILTANSGATLNLNANIDTGVLNTLTVDGSGSTVLSGTIPDTGATPNRGRETLHLPGPTPSAGVTAVTAGVVLATPSGAFGNTADVVVANGAAVQVQGGSLSGSTPLTINAPLFI